MEFYFRRFLCEFGQPIQAQQVRLSDIFEIRTDCHRKAHAMRNIHKAVRMPLSRTLSRLMTVKKSGDNFQIIECHPFKQRNHLSNFEFTWKMPLQRDWLIIMLNGVDTISAISFKTFDDR